MLNQAKKGCKSIGVLHNLMADYNFLSEKINTAPQKNKIIPVRQIMQVKELETTGTAITDRGFIDQASADGENVSNEILLYTIAKR